MFHSYDVMHEIYIWNNICATQIEYIYLMFVENSTNISYFSARYLNV